MTVQEFNARAQELYPTLGVTRMGDFMNAIGYSRSVGARGFHSHGVGARAAVILRLLERLSYRDIQILINENTQITRGNYGKE